MMTHAPLTASDIHVASYYKFIPLECRGSGPEQGGQLVLIVDAPKPGHYTFTYLDKYGAVGEAYADELTQEDEANA